MKTEYLTGNVDELGTINVDGVDLPRTDAFEYLGSRSHPNNRYNMVFEREKASPVCVFRLFLSLSLSVIRPDSANSAIGTTSQK